MLKLYNTLTKSIEEFKPLHPDVVTIYACGPTVYDYAHIGNFRTYTMTDFLVRTLKYLGFSVKYVMNITDVGHLVSDSDTGQDKMEKGATREGKTAWDIATFYTQAFLTDSKKLNLLAPDVRPKPTEHIAEQIQMIHTLIAKGYAYTIDDGIYFDTTKFSDYGKLTGQNREKLKSGARVEVNPQKKNPLDFALWKFSYPKGRAFDSMLDTKKRDMEWDSPWGKGFPGWHIECSSMSRKYLGDQIDIHTGGVDLIPIHHTNEIAQSEAATDEKPFVRHWVHGQFILVGGEKMAKSKNNFYHLSDVEDHGIEPLALRFFYAGAHYRTFLNFTWESLQSAQQSLTELRNQLIQLKLQKTERSTLSEEKLKKVDVYKAKFKEALENDLNIPQALAIIWEVIKSNIPPGDKYDVIMDFDEVLGLELSSFHAAVPKEVPGDIQRLVDQRRELRLSGKFKLADKVRVEIENKGYVLEDTSDGTRVKKKT